MKYTNITTVTNFKIIGFPGLPPEYYGLVSFILFVVFLAIVLGNLFIIVVIISERTLHKSTYLIFFHLAMSDILFGVVTLPKIIARYWWNDMLSSFRACFTQMYFIHSLGAIHCLILLMMALDRFVAIWFPLKYHTLLTNKVVSVACSLCWVFTFIRMMGIVLHASTLPYCDRNTVMQCFCDLISVTDLGCGSDVAYAKLVAFANAMITLLVPLTFIIVSYFSIIIAVLKMSLKQRHNKVLSTCAPQIFVTCLYFLPRCFIYITNNLGFKFSLDAGVIITMLYSLIPAAVNPVIYCFKTMEIKQALMRRFMNRKISTVLKSDCNQVGRYICYDAN